MFIKCINVLRVKSDLSTKKSVNCSLTLVFILIVVSREIVPNKWSITLLQDNSYRETYIPEDILFARFLIGVHILV
jgi:hypothetical protein